MPKNVRNPGDKQAAPDAIAKTDWIKCAICQQNKGEPLRCPADSKRLCDVGSGYKTLAGNITKFRDLDCMPIQVDLSRLDEGEGLENTFVRWKARWHKSCYDLFNSTKLKRAEKRQALESEQAVGGKYTRSASPASLDNCGTCFFCEEYSTRNNPLHNVSTFGLDARVRKCAMVLQDEKLLAKLSAGDLVALEAKYHTPCLASLYKKTERVKEEGEEDETSPRLPEGIALAELVSFIEESRMVSTAELPVFRLAELVDKYTSRLKQLGENTPARIHTTRLKDRILSQIPALEEHKQGRDVFLAFKTDLANALQKAHKEDIDEEAMHLAKAAIIVRKEMFTQKYTFDGSFESNCQADSIPPSLVSLVNMILYGPNIEMQASTLTKSQSGLTISQLLQYNSYHRRSSGEVKRERRNKSRETPLPIFVGLSIHAKTRSRDLVENMHTLGLSVSYDRVLSISTDLGNAVCRRYQEENVVCPCNLRLNLFTTAAVDNIDHNPSSTTAQDSFHGTGISLFQHTTNEIPGSSRGCVNISQTTANTKSVAELPVSYTEVAPAVLPNKTPPVPETSSQLQGGSTVNRAMEMELDWLEDVNGTIKNHPSLEDKKSISWAAYHSTTDQQRNRAGLSALSALLPLFPDQAKSVAMIRHAMDVIKACVNYLNPGQVPVVAMDQPLYAVAKQIQWNWKDSYGENKFVIMFGGLHIEMAFLKVIGDWLDESGWTAALVEANVATPGTAESFIKATSVTRSRRAHQVTASSLYVLLQKAYAKYSEGLNDGDDLLLFDDWCAQQVSAVPQFQFWYIALH